MYKIENKEFYHVFDKSANKYVRTFMSYEQLIEYIVRYQNYPPLRTYYHAEVQYENRFYRDCATCENDQKVVTERIKTEDYYGLHFEYVNRIYIIYDSYGRIINPVDLYSDVLNLLKHPNKSNNLSYWDKELKRLNIRYRIDPVPTTGKKRYRSRYYRKFAIHNEIKSNSDVEIKEFVRPRRNPNGLISIYGIFDYPVRKNEKNWKSQGKKKHQWER